MNARYVAEFTEPDTLRRAFHKVRECGHNALDVFTPYPLEDLAEHFEARGNVRLTMLIAGVGVAAFAFWLQWYSATIDYPFNSGGRPLNSWPVFLLVPFEVGVFAAGLGGMIAFFVGCGLPALYHPLFDVPGFERASQDRFFLLVEAETSEAGTTLRHMLEHLGSVAVSSVNEP